jgi:LmbE family N-acetylglucosaminyl deacetylase
MQSIEFTPTFVVDVSEVWEQRIQALQAFESQFHNPGYESNEPETFVSNKGFFDWVEARARVHGYRIGAEFGEPFLYRHGPVGVTDLVKMLGRERTFR